MKRSKLIKSVGIIMSLTLVVNVMSTTMKNNWDNKSIDELLA